MKSQIFLLAFIAVLFSSCTSAYRSGAYKTGQTPDDVYFSPARAQDEYVQVEKQDDRRYQSVDDYYDERFLRMRVQNRYRWSALDEYYFNGSYHPYSYYGYSSHWNNPWNNYYTWNTYYNPYCHVGYGGGYGGIIVKNPWISTPPPSRPIAFSTNSYLGNNQYNGIKASGYSNNYYNGGTRYNNSNSGNRGGNSRTYSNSNSRSNDSYSPSSSTPSRSYTPSSSSSSGSSSRPSSSGSSGGSSGGSSSGGSSRPPR